MSSIRRTRSYALSVLGHSLLAARLVSEIRRRLASGDNQVDVPAAVLGYIRARALYSVRP